MGLDEKIKKTVVQEIEDIMKDKATKKKFRYKFGKKVGKSQRKKNYVTTLVLYENGTCDFQKYQIEDQTILHDEIPRLATAGHVMYDRKGNPLLILPNWSVEPFSPLKHFKESLIDGSNKKGYKIIMNAMEREKTDTKKKIGGAAKLIIGLIVAAVIGYALISGGGA